MRLLFITIFLVDVSVLGFFLSYFGLIYLFRFMFSSPVFYGSFLNAIFTIRMI